MHLDTDYPNTDQSLNLVKRGRGVDVKDNKSRLDELHSEDHLIVERARKIKEPKCHLRFPFFISRT